MECKEKPKSPTIAIIDDDKRWLKTYIRGFRRLKTDYQFATYQNPHLFLETVLENPKQYQGALCDVKMPQMSGFKVHSILQKNDLTKNIPFIFASASVCDEGNILKQEEVYIPKGGEDFCKKIIEAFDEMINKWPNLEKKLLKQSLDQAIIDSSKQLYFKPQLVFFNILNLMPKISDDDSIFNQLRSYIKKVEENSIQAIKTISQIKNLGEFSENVMRKCNNIAQMVSVYQMLIDDLASDSQKLEYTQKELEKLAYETSFIDFKV